MDEQQHIAKVKKVRVIDSLWTFFIAVAVVGPFALPLLWRNPRFKVRTKIFGSLAIIIFTWLLIKLTGNIFQQTLDQYQQMKAMMGS